MNGENGGRVFTSRATEGIVMRTTAVVAGFLAALVVLSGAFVGGIAADTTPTQTDTTQAENETGTSASFGAEVSSFMQASSAEAEGGVEDGMFGAALKRANDSDERRAIVEARIDELENRQKRLENRRQALDNASSGVRQVAIAAHVMVGAKDLQDSINETERAAEAVGVDTQRLERLRSNASELSGPEVAEIARGLAGPVENPGKSDDAGPPGGAPGAGASGDQPGQSNGSDGNTTDAENGSDAGDGNSSGADGSGSSDGGGAEPGNDGGGGGSDGAAPGDDDTGADDDAPA